MVPAPSYEHIDLVLNSDSFKVGGGYAHGIGRDRKLVAFVFFDQNFARPPVDDFVQNIELMNRHSGTLGCGPNKFIAD